MLAVLLSVAVKAGAATEQAGLQHGGPADNEIVLDPRIRDWVLMPIFIVMFLQGVLRQYVSVLLADAPRVHVPTVARTLLLQRSARLRAHCQFLPAAAFRMRKQFFTQKAFREKPAGQTGDDAANPMNDPFAMVGMMKQNMAMILPNMLLMGWVSYFFSGFVLVKLPFGLSDRFKSMLQRGVNLKSLDASYVSSLSWYFLTLFGLRGVFSLVLGDNNVTNETKMMEQQMSMGMAGAQGPDPNAAQNAERTELEIVHHKFAIERAELRLIGKAPRKNAKK